MENTFLLVLVPALWLLASQLSCFRVLLGSVWLSSAGLMNPVQCRSFAQEVSGAALN